MKEEILPSEKEVFNAIIDQLFKKYDALEEINKQQALEIARLKDRINKTIEYINDIPALIWNEAHEFDYDFDKLLEILGGENE